MCHVCHRPNSAGGIPGPASPAFRGGVLGWALREDAGRVHVPSLWVSLFRSKCGKADLAVGRSRPRGPKDCGCHMGHVAGIVW